MLSGKYPSESEEDAATGDHIPVHEHNPQIPAKLSGVVSKALAPTPDGRYATAREMRGALLQCDTYCSWTKVSDLPNERWVAHRDGDIYELSITATKSGFSLTVTRDRGKGPRRVFKDAVGTPAKMRQTRRRLLRRLVEGKKIT
ncbi:MAG: hypothetical protein WCE62_03700 [Polyangiales bacterium]